MKRIYEIEIWEIEVDEFYFNFPYTVKVFNGDDCIDIIKWEINDDHSWSDDIERWKRELKKEVAYELVLQDLF